MSSTRRKSVRQRAVRRRRVQEAVLGNRALAALRGYDEWYDHPHLSVSDDEFYAQIEARMETAQAAAQQALTRSMFAEEWCGVSNES